MNDESLVALREFSELDIWYKIKWINDPSNNKYLHYDLPINYDKTLAWYHNKDKKNRYDAVIEYNQIPVGIIGLLNIEVDKTQAEYYITMGENEFKGKGIAYEATKILLEYAFNYLELKKVYLYTEVDNIIAQHLFEKVGFVQKKLLENHLVYNNRKIDRYFYVCLNPNYDIGISLKTPIQNLGRYKNNNLYMKREDMIPFSFGGNKARKAFYFIKDFLLGDYDCIVTYGTSSSNHCRVIANFAIKLNVECYIISPKEQSKTTFNSKMVDVFNAHVNIVDIEKVSDTIDMTINELKGNGKKPYFIAGGGHGNLGTKAYVDCFKEINDYEKDKCIYFDYIFLASGTGTTQAGLIVGKLLTKSMNNIIGISVARKNPYGRNVIMNSVNDYLKNIKNTLPEMIIENNTVFLDEYTNNQYGKSSIEINKVIVDVLSDYGIPLDATYTGKAFIGMCDYIEKNDIEGKNVLFIHTGGTPLFFNTINNLVGMEKNDD